MIGLKIINWKFSIQLYKGKATLSFNNITKNINPWWITGIIDSEGKFIINYNKKTKKFSFSFKVVQDYKSLIILKYLVKYFLVGSVTLDYSKLEGYKYVVSNKKDIIDIIIPHFDLYPLQGSKYLDFLDFKKCILLMEQDSSTNIDLVLQIKKTINRSRSFEERWHYLKEKPFNLKPEWIQAFINGAGSFQYRIDQIFIWKHGHAVFDPILEIPFPTHDIFLLKAIINFFSMGYIKPKYIIFSLKESKKSRRTCLAIFNNYQIIIKFVDKYTMLTPKRLYYVEWKHIIGLRQKLDFPALKGKENLIRLRLDIFKTRLFNPNLITPKDKFDLAKSIFSTKKTHNLKSKIIR